MIGIYKIENTVNGKVYIGKSINIEQRWNEHVTMLNKDRHHSIKLQRAWNKYGKDNFKFTVIEECNREDLNIKESKFINEFDSIKNGYNMIDNHEGIGITEDELQIITKESFEKVLNLTSVFGAKFNIAGSTYKDRFMNMHYSYGHYDRCYELINFIISSGIYEEATKITLTIVAKRNTVRIYYKGKMGELLSFNPCEYSVLMHTREGGKYVPTHWNIYRESKGGVDNE